MKRPFGELPHGVTLGAACIVDEVRGKDWPLNHTAVDMLELVVREPLPVAAARLADMYSLPIDRATRDLLAFCRDCNSKSLLNIRETWGTYLVRLFRWAPKAIRSLLLAGMLLPPPSPATTRRALDTDNYLRAVDSTIRCLSWPALKLGLVIGSVTALPMLAIGGVPAVLTMFVVAMAIGLSVLVHEGGHVVMLIGTPCSLETAGIQVWVRHGPVHGRKQLLAAAGGPLAASSLAVLAVLLAEVSGVSSLAFLVAGLAPHAMALTVLSRDGRRACGLLS